MPVLISKSWLLLCHLQMFYKNYFISYHICQLRLLKLNSPGSKCRMFWIVMSVHKTGLPSWLCSNALSFGILSQRFYLWCLPRSLQRLLTITVPALQIFAWLIFLMCVFPTISTNSFSFQTSEEAPWGARSCIFMKLLLWKFIIFTENFTFFSEAK